MAVYGHTVVEVFDNNNLVDNAVNALQGAGFDPGQIYVSEHEAARSGDLWQGIKRLFSRGRGDDDVINDLKNMGIPDDRIQYYQNEYNVGHDIVAVNAAGSEDNVAALMRENGGHD
jgi:orotidine-5'-phosphate decarboxylase